MERGASPLLAARGAQRTGIDAIDHGRAVGRRRGRMRAALASFGNTCALAGVALLACVALVAVGTICSLLWMLVAER